MIQFPRMTCNWKIGLAKSYRNTSQKIGSDKRPMFGGSYGTNLQNPDKTICSIYKPDDGKIFVQRDQSGAEALIVAYEADAGNFRDLFLYGIKPHSYVAIHRFTKQLSTIWPDLPFEEFTKTPIRELKKHPDWKRAANCIKETDGFEAARRYYFISKCCCHAGNYKIGPAELQVNLLLRSDGEVNVSRRDAEEFLVLYNQKLFPEIPIWQFRVADLVKNTKYLRNLFGYPRYFGDIFTDTYWKDALSWIPQSTVGCITHIAITRMQQYIEEAGKDWDILNNKHDSYLLQCPIDERDECANKMQEFIELDLTSSRGEKFKMKSEAQAGFNWAPWHETKNPEGMKEI